MQNEAQVVIIGGGVIGCSVAYHLTRLGIKEVILLEQEPYLAQPGMLPTWCRSSAGP